MLGYLDETIAVASQEVTNEPLVLRNSIRIPARNCAVVPVYCAQMFSGKVMAVLCDELNIWNQCRWTTLKVKVMTLFPT